MRKRIAAMVLALCLVLGMLPASALAAEEAPASERTEPVGEPALEQEEIPEPLADLATQADGDFTINASGVLTKYTGPGGDVIIPNGVTSIGSSAFFRCTGLTSVVIPDSVTRIGSSAFSSCTGLTSVVIPDSVTRIGDEAFDGCSSLTSVTIPGSVTRIGTEAFDGCSSLTSVTIPDSVTEIGVSAFRDCSSLTSVTIPDSVTQIWGNAFQGCSGLTRVTISDSITSIEASTFNGCSSLTSVIIPDSVTSIEGSAFMYCSSLTSVTIPDSVTSIKVSAFVGCSSLTSVAIPDSVARIDSRAFDSRSLTDIYYGGTEGQWNAIKNEHGNTYRTNATIHYNSTGPDTPDTPDIPDTPEIQLTGGPSSIFTGDLNATVLSFAVTCGERDASGTVSWTSSNENVFRLTGEHTSRPYAGLRTAFEVRGDALSEGTSTITVSTAGGVQAKFTVVVKEKRASQIEISGNHTVYKGKSETLSTRITFGDILQSSPTVTWTSSDSSVIAFSSSGAGRISKSVSVTSAPVSFDVPLYGRSIGNATIVCSLSTGEKESFNVAVEEEPIDFDLNIYRANKLLDPTLQLGSNLNGMLRTQTPCDIFAASLRESGFGTGASAWTALTTAIGAVDKPSSLYDFAVKQQDVYSAIILSMLEASSDINIADTYKETYTDAKEFLSKMKSVIELKYDTDFDDFANLADMPDYMRADMKGSFDEYYKKRYPELEELDSLFSALDTLFNTVDRLENIVEKFNAVITMARFSDSLKTVIRTMEQRCPASNAALKLALADCVDIIDKSIKENIAKINADEWVAVGADLSKFFVDEFWKDVKNILNAGFPGLNIILTAYTASAFFTNSLFDIDSLTEQYYKMLATMDVENLVGDVYQVLGEQYVQNISTERAAAYLSAIDMLFAARDQDCVAAYDFVDKLDSAAVSKIANKMGLSGHSYDNLKRNIDGIQRNYITRYLMVLGGWIDYLETDYPGSGLEEKYRLLFDEIMEEFTLNKKYVIACPVDVYVYDRQGNRVASVVDNQPYCDGDITIVVEKDVKTLYFYNGDEYRIEYVGNDSGSMDLTITEYGENRGVLRDVYFYDVPLTVGRQYEMNTDGRTLGEVTYRLTGQNTGPIAPDLDTYRPERVKHTVRIVSGSMVKQDELLFETDAYPGEQIEIYAYIPENAGFIGWTSDAGTAIFADPKSSVTKIRMPDSDVTLTAVLQKSSSQPGDLNGDGKVTMADVLRLARGAAGHVTLTEQEQRMGDVNGDGKITMTDVIRVARYAAGHSSTL